MLTTWWVWVAAGFMLGVIEVLVPGFIFLGFAIGAVITGMLVGLGALGENAAILALVFAFASLASWFALHRVFGVGTGQKKHWDKDINE